MIRRPYILLFLLPLLLLISGCVQFQQVVMKFDMKAGTGEFRYLNLTSDGSAEAGTDFRELIEKYLQGMELETQYKLWTNVKKELYEEDGKLNGVVTFAFADPAATLIYKHDKKSPYIFCAGAESEILTSNGKDISKVMPGCVAWERKIKVLELTVAGAGATSGLSAPVPLLDFYKAWKADGTLPPKVDPAVALQQSLKELEEIDIEGMFEELIPGGTSDSNPCAPKANPCAPKANPCAPKANPCAAD